MHIHSFIREINYETTNCQLSNTSTDDDHLTAIDKNFKHNKEVLLNIQAIYSTDLYIQQYVLNTHIPLTKEFTCEGKLIKFSFHLKGQSKVSYQKQYEPTLCQVGTVFTSLGRGGKISGRVQIEPEEELQYITIYLTPNYYCRLLKHEEWIREDLFYQQVVSNIDQTNITEAPCYMNIQIYTILSDIMHSAHLGSHQRDYLNIKLKELFFMLHLQKQADHISPHSTLSQERFESIKSYLINHMDKNPSLEQLAGLFHISERKLKLAFKEHCGVSMHSFLVEAKMIQAQELIKKDYNVNELANRLGYQSVSHFIKIFKKHFGTTPKDFLMTYK